MQPQILLLKEGTENTQGWQQVISNINACSAIVDAIRTTLGPRGMDKLIVDNRGKATISNDGATIMKLLDVVHPAAKTLVEIAKSQVYFIILSFLKSYFTLINLKLYRFTLPWYCLFYDSVDSVDTILSLKG